MYIALLTGLLGGFHCLGMCGTLALTLSFGHRFGALFYHGGRILTYIFIGWIFGLIGEWLYMGLLQQYLSVLLGVLIILLTVLPQLHVSWAHRIGAALQGLWQRLSAKPSGSNIFLRGMLNGLLPCGLVYLAALGATATNNPLEGATYMLLFGLGTTPLLLLLSWGGQVIAPRWRIRLSRAIPYFAVLVGLLLILRGLGLGIPYISPQFAPFAACCKVILP